MPKIVQERHSFLEYLRRNIPPGLVIFESENNLEDGGSLHVRRKGILSSIFPIGSIVARFRVNYFRQVTGLELLNPQWEQTILNLMDNYEDYSGEELTLIKPPSV